MTETLSILLSDWSWLSDHVTWILTSDWFSESCIGNVIPHSLAASHWQDYTNITLSLVVTSHQHPSHLTPMHYKREIGLAALLAHV